MVSVGEWATFIFLAVTLAKIIDQLRKRIAEQNLFPLINDKQLKVN